MAFDLKKHDENLKKLNGLKSKIILYRNKRLCHSTSVNVGQKDIPQFSTIDSIMDTLEDLMLEYGRLFGTVVVFDGFNLFYTNPLMKPKK